MEKRKRREIIRELIAENPPGSQMELVRELAARGVTADQSTVSRDLREMGVVRLPGRNREFIYGFPGQKSIPVPGDELRRGLVDYAIEAESSGALVVLRTAPGNAQALAAIMDRARLEEVAGTVAGDDTILVVVREGYDAGELAEEFRSKAEG